MATAKRNQASRAKSPAAEAPVPGGFVTQEQFSGLEKGVSKMTDLLEKLLTEKKDLESVGPGPAGAAKVESPAEKAISKAGPNQIPMNPEWEELAGSIIGEAMERCEIAYLKNGGVIFTVIIKKSHSNAPKDYLEMYKTDRRSKEIGSEGLEGVEAWCKQIKSNLARSK